MSNLGAEAARSYLFLRCEAENVLRMFLNLHSDFVSPDDFDGVEVILERFINKNCSLVQTEFVSCYTKYALKYLD